MDSELLVDFEVASLGYLKNFSEDLLLNKKSDSGVVIDITDN